MILTTVFSLWQSSPFLSCHKACDSAGSLLLPRWLSLHLMCFPLLSLHLHWMCPNTLFSPIWEPKGFFWWTLVHLHFPSQWYDLAHAGCLPPYSLMVSWKDFRIINSFWKGPQGHLVQHPAQSKSKSGGNCSSGVRMLEAHLCTVHKVKILLHSQDRKPDFPAQPAAGHSRRTQGLWRSCQDNHLSSEQCLQWIQGHPSFTTWIQPWSSRNLEVSSLLCPPLTAWPLLYPFHHTRNGCW